MIRCDQTPFAAHKANFVFLSDLDEHRLGVHIMPSLYKAKMEGRLAHTIRKFLGQDLGPGISVAPLDLDFEQVRSKGNGSGPDSDKPTYQDLRRDAVYLGVSSSDGVGMASSLLYLRPKKPKAPSAAPKRIPNHLPTGRASKES